MRFSDLSARGLILRGSFTGFAGVLIGTAIITTVLCTRLHFAAVATISFFYSAILYPMVSHWLWLEHGWMQLHKTTVRDYAGGLAIYTTASTFAAIGAIILGRRLLLLREISDISVRGIDVSRNTVAGFVFVLMGLIVSFLPTPEDEYLVRHSNFDGLLFTNGVLALSTTGLVCMLCDVSIGNANNTTYWSLLKYLQAATAGIIALSCGVDNFSPLASFCVGLTAGILFFITGALFQYSFIEDNCNILASSFVCSFLASLSSQLVTERSTNFEAILTKDFTWQLTCYFVILCASCASAIVIFLLLYSCRLLKSESEKLNHNRAVVASKSKREGISLKKVFTDPKTAVYVEPGASKTIINEIVETIVVKPKPKRIGRSGRDSDMATGRSVKQIWPPDDNVSLDRKGSKKFVNLQKSSSSIKRSRTKV